MKISKKTDNLKPNGKKDNNTKTIAIIIFCIIIFDYNKREVKKRE